MIRVLNQLCNLDTMKLLIKLINSQIHSLYFPNTNTHDNEKRRGIEKKEERKTHTHNFTDIHYYLSINAKNLDISKNSFASMRSAVENAKFKVSNLPLASRAIFTPAGNFSNLYCVLDARFSFSLGTAIRTGTWYKTGMAPIKYNLISN